jgi:hypothetical protein
MKDLTLIYYTSNKISDHFANMVRYHLWKHSSKKSIPIISVSQEPIGFGDNICVGDIGLSFWNIYHQILIGAKEAKTKYVACCEDDSLYTYEHFKYRPNDDEFAYNTSRWNVQPDLFYFRRNRPGMCMCIAPTELMVKTLETRFEKYPADPYQSIKKMKYFGEPGRYETELELPVVKRVHFNSDPPGLTFNHRQGLGGMRKLLKTDLLKDEIPFWGKASDLWSRVHG